MNILDPRGGAVDADMLARRNTRLLLGALAQMTGFTLIIGPLALNQVREAIRRMGAKRGNAATLHSYYDIWLERATSARVVRIVTGEELSDHQHRNPIHRWVEYTWEVLQGDEDDVEHVCVALACGAGVVLTGNMTCIDSDRLATAAAEADLNVPLVLKRDRCIEHFRQISGQGATLAMIESAVLPNTLGDPDMRGMMQRLAHSLRHSFPALRREILANLRTHEEYVSIGETMPPHTMTREVVAEMWELSM